MPAWPTRTVSTVTCAVGAATLVAGLSAVGTAAAHTYDPETIREAARQHAATGGRSIPAATATIREGTRVSLSGAARNSVYACQAGNPGAPGSISTPWLVDGAFSWSSKPTVDGKVYWRNARVRVYTTASRKRVILANGQPRNTPTGVFPIASDSTAYQYDRNPGTVGSRTVKVTMPAAPSRLKSPRCLPPGVIGYLTNGTALFNALDGRGNDAVAHEVLDLCQGHPAGSLYHYHWPSLCLTESGNASRASGVIGWALDGYPITGPRGARGRLYTNSDLDVCHGTTSVISLGGRPVRTYHYVGNFEYPYTLGCFRAAPVTDSSQSGALPGAGGGGPGPGGPPPGGGPPPRP